jgi:ABC-type antimicrobial peptide transport system permease subunit
VFYLRYIGSELRRRRGRTIATALGLGVGVALVVAVSALSNGLSEAQSKVLKPLTGVGTDMSVTRPIKISGSGSSKSFRPGLGGAQLPKKEREELEKENGGGHFSFGERKAGEKFNVTRFTTTNLSFSESEASKIEAIKGVTGTAGGLTLDMINLSGTVPQASESSGGFGGRGGFAGGGAPGAGGQPGGFNFQPISVSGVDVAKASLALITPGQIVKGKYLTGGEGTQAVLSQSYADEKSISIGSKVEVDGKDFTVVGIAEPPLGGQSSDIYVPLKELQKLSGREGKINTLEVSAANASEVGAVAKQIKASFSGSQTTTSEELAKSVTGSLVDAKKLSSSLGTALAIVALVAAFLIASLLTLASVNKRTREIGTLKAVGWSQRLVIRQISGESVAQGLLGGVIGAILGIVAAAVIGALGITLKATVPSGSSSAAGGAPFGGGGPFGQGHVTSGSTTVKLNAPVDVGIVLIAIALAILGGLIAGAVGGARAARLRPAEALRSVE